MSDSYRTKIGANYFQIENALKEMHKNLEFAEDHPAQVSTDEAFNVRVFAEELDDIMYQAYVNFIGFMEG